ncbi:MAG TPA: YXWGXW repeat-containing protein [Polyangiaceae bacterium]|nr:YXWGXW repeat-containing protein [Polyangiaceae bacterium]
MRWVAHASLAVLAACADRLPHPPYARQPTTALETVGYPPPPARIEFVPPHPAARGAVWIDGEWAWQGRRWAWRMGRWVEPPPGARYSPWTVVRGDDGSTYYAAGAWRDARGAELAEPVALVVARANLSDVVDPEGELETTGRSIRPAQTSSGDAGAGAPPEGLPDGGAIAPADAGSRLDDAP